MGPHFGGVSNLMLTCMVRQFWRDISRGALTFWVGVGCLGFIGDFTSAKYNDQTAEVTLNCRFLVKGIPPQKTLNCRFRNYSILNCPEYPTQLCRDYFISQYKDPIINQSVKWNVKRVCSRATFFWLWSFWQKSCERNLPDDSKWPFYPLVGGHLAFKRVTLPSQKGHKELLGGSFRPEKNEEFKPRWFMGIICPQPFRPSFMWPFFTEIM